MPGCRDSESAAASNLPDPSEICSICFTSSLDEEPCVQLGCGHIFHANCVLELLKHKWTTLRISFAFMSCPSCKHPIEASHIYEISEELEKLYILRSDLQVKAMKIARSQQIDKDPRLSTPGDHYFGNPVKLAEAKVSFYMCSLCDKPYFGGLIDCEQEQGMQDTTRREDLICRICLMKEMSIGSTKCKNGHGDQFIDWKCQWCCSVAIFNCAGGTLWMCDRHHTKGPKVVEDCGGKNCPLNIPHPAA